MAIKSRLSNGSLLLHITLFLFFMGCTHFLAAQTSGYFIDTESSELRFIQRLAWTGGEHALRYEVVIQREEDGGYRDYLSDFTTVLFIDVSLPPGNYRFHVITYNIFNRPDSGSDWMYIEVRRAIQPEVTGSLPEYTAGDDGEPSGYILNVQGNNLDPEAEYAIQFPDGTIVVPSVIDSGEGNSARLCIEEEHLLSTEYEVIVRNPGGLESAAEGIVDTGYIRSKITEKEEEGKREKGTALINFGIAWQPLFPVYGGGFDRQFYQLGAAARLNLLFRTPLNLYAGPELTASWLGLDEDGELNHIVYAGVNLVIMKWLYDYRLGFGYRAGASYFVLPEDFRQICVNMGVSVHWRIAGAFTLEIGINYSHLFEDPPAGYLSPWAGIGLVF
jgi:hypothetical protein